MPRHIRHYGSLAQMFKASGRHAKSHTIGSVTAMVDGAWRTSQHGGRGRQIPVDTGATRFSGRVGVGRPTFRGTPRRFKGAHYPARSPTEAEQAMRSYRLSNRIFISYGHPGGLLARNLISSRTGKPFSRKVPTGVGFMGMAMRGADRALRRYQGQWRPGR